MALKDDAGLVKQFAMLDIQRYQNVAVGNTVAECQKAYQALLATNGVLADSAWTPARLRSRVRSHTSPRRWWKATRTST